MYKFIQGCVCTSKDLARTSVRQSVARKLGEWHSVLPVTSLSDLRGTYWEAPYSLDPFVVVPLSDRKIHSITPGKKNPNLWTVLQKWILALPNGTEQETKRNIVLQKELERTVIELGNLPGLGKGGVCFDFSCFGDQSLLTLLISARLRSLWPSFWEHHRPSSSIRSTYQYFASVIHRLRVRYTCPRRFRHSEPLCWMGRFRLRLQRATHAFPASGLYRGLSWQLL